MRVWARGGWNGRILCAALCLTGAVFLARPAEAAGGGDTCASATVIAALPYTDAFATTCGFADDTNNTGAASCSELPSTYPGPDSFYRLDLGTGNSVAISVDFPNGAIGDLAVFLLQISSCGGAASCANQSVDVIGAGQGPERIKAKSYPPGTYYVVVDSINAVPAASACGVYSLSVTGSLGVVSGAGGAGGSAGSAGASGAGGTGVGGAAGGSVVGMGGSPAGGGSGTAGAGVGGVTGGLGGSPSTGGTSGTIGSGGGSAGGAGGGAVVGGPGGALSSGGASAGAGGPAGAGGLANGGSSSTGGTSPLGGQSGAAGAGGTLAGAAGRSAAAGTSGAAGTKGAGGTVAHMDGGTDSATTDSSSGCSCETTGHGSTNPTLLTALTLALGLSLSRRRRQR